MKRYRVKSTIYIIFPLAVSIIILIYMTFLYRKSYYWVNIVNISFDAIILIYYFKKFCYEIASDKENLYIYTIFKNYRIPLKSYKGALYSSFLIKINTEIINFYLLNTSKDRYKIKGILGDDKDSK